MYCLYASCRRSAEDHVDVCQQQHHHRSILSQNTHLNKQCDIKFSKSLHSTTTPFLTGYDGLCGAILPLIRLDWSPCTPATLVGKTAEGSKSPPNPTLDNFQVANNKSGAQSTTWLAYQLWYSLSRRRSQPEDAMKCQRCRLSS